METKVKITDSQAKQISVKSSQELMQCMANNDYYSFVALEREMSVSKAMKGVQLRNLESKVSSVNVIKSLSFLITNFNNNFNAKGKLTEEQIIVLAGDLFDRFSYESLEDVMLMLKYARQGKIGDGKDFKLDSQTVFHKWVPAYLELKAIERENKHTKKKGEASGIANFKWDKENLEKFEVSKKENKVGKSFGERTRDAFNTDHLAKPNIKQVVQSDFLEKAKASAKEQSTESLKTYLKAEKKSVMPNESMIRIVEGELESRCRTK